jgi:signal transduction histidine kinase/ActR/RegA family two-component response regulator
LAVTEVARQVMERRDFSLRVRKTTEDEIGYLVDTFNAMLTEVGRRATILEETNRALEHEMTERRGAESALLAADKRKDEFLATLAHELRNPLAPLRNALEILRLAGNDAGVAQTARDMMERQLQQLVRLVDDLLDVSRITTGKLTLKKEQVDLRTIVENAVDAVNPIIRARQQKLAVALPSEPVFLYVDATRLAQVFLNLLNNAAKFTDPEGQISFSAELKDGNVIATVTDTGIGIPADMLPIIFDMFAQADRSLERPNAGLGVGLSLAQRLVELHGGAIEAYSEGAGRGSRFVVRIPAIAAAVPRPAVAHEAIESTQTEARRAILLADDNEDFAASFAMLLRRMGHEVKIAHDGNEALDAALSFTPDLAFLDIGLPKINGYDLARRLRQELREKPIVLIAVTGWGQDSDKLQARNAGFDHHMVKPVEFEQIRRILTAAGLPSYQ